MNENDGASFLLEQIKNGVEGKDHTELVLPDASEISDLGDGIAIEVTNRENQHPVQTPPPPPAGCLTHPST